MYALIKWGGQVEGQRPKTALAYVWESDRGWKAELLNPDGTTRYKRPRGIERSEVLVQFGTKEVPSQRLVRAAKSGLPIEDSAA